MSGPLGSHELMYATGSDFYAHQIASSTRFNGTGYLNDARSGDGSNSHGTISCWFKRAKLGAYQYIFSAHEDGNNAVRLTILADDTLEFRGETGGAVKFEIETTNVFRDTSAWYHFVGIIDMDNGTQADRAQVYINGERQTVLDTSTMPADASQTMVLNTGANLRIGAASDASYDFHGYITEFVVIDGTAQAVSDFGETKNGVWVPKDPSGLTFGTNGVYLKMADSSNLGTDSSGNGHTFALTNVDADDHTLDSPTFGGSSSGNFCVLNPINNVNSATLSEGNTKGTGGGAWVAAYGTFEVPVTGSWYWECISENHVYGYPGVQTTTTEANQQNHDFVAVQTGEYRYEGSGEANTSSIGTGDIIAFHVNNGVIKVYVNNSLDHTFGTNMSAGAHAGGQTMPYYPSLIGSSAVVFNFGQDSSFAGAKTAQGNKDSNGFGDFYYSPKGLALCTGNVLTAAEIDPAETDDNFPQKLFNAVPYTGNDGGTSNNITFSFKPDMAIMKMRGNTGGGYGAQIWDTTRGDDYYMYPAGTAASVTSGTDYLEFTSTGLKLDDSWDGLNPNGETYIAHGWRANGGTTSSNSNGQITSTVQVDPSGCFSILTYTGESATRTVGHGLSTTPESIWVKATANTYGWSNYFKGNGLNKIAFNGTGNDTGASALYGGTHPTSTVFSVGDGQETGKSVAYIAYAFAPCPGYIRIGIYEGNNNDNGTFVYTGFSPAYVLTKNIDDNDDWIVYDNERPGYNVTNIAYSINTTGAEATTYRDMDFLANGFKWRTSNSNVNAAETYAFIAFAHNPLKYATAR